MSFALGLPNPSGSAMSSDVAPVSWPNVNVISQPDNLGPNPAAVPAPEPQNPIYGDERDERLCTHVREDGSLCKGWRIKGGSAQAMPGWAWQPTPGGLQAYPPYPGKKRQRLGRSALRGPL